MSEDKFNVQAMRGRIDIEFHDDGLNESSATVQIKIDDVLAGVKFSEFSIHHLALIFSELSIRARSAAERRTAREVGVKKRTG